MTTATPTRRPKGDIPKMVAELARGATQKEAAAAAGISDRGVRRRLDDPEIQAQIVEARAEIRRRTMAAIADASLEAVQTLRDLQGVEQAPQIRFQAAKVLLHTGVKNIEAMERDEEIDVLRARIRAELESGE